jgi:AcrR family transcriptional regulator
LQNRRSSSKQRGYEMKARLTSMEQTRLRITEATMRLHEEVGPAATTVAAVANEAGVTRLTVYRHFPDEEALVHACSAHWSALHPRPDPHRWSAVSDPVARARVALSETYAWAATAAPMMTMIYRDVRLMPAFVADSLAAEERARVDILAKGFGARGRRVRRLHAALAHALHIKTWESLCVENQLTADEAVELMVAAILAAVDRPAS